MKVLIIEDEKPAARRLARLLEARGVEVPHLLHSVAESIAWFSDHPHPDLIFLDIQLSDGLSFEIFDAVSVRSPIIFTTAYDEYALQAFKLNSIDYLLKPIDEEELDQALEQYRELSPPARPVQMAFEDIRKLLGNPLEREYKKRFTTRVGSHIKIIQADEVECFYSQNKGTYAATIEGRSYLLDTTLDKLEQELSPEMFFRVSRKFYVHIDHIADIIAYTNSRLKIKMKRFREAEIIVSRERVRDFKFWLE
ncbi:MAG: LytTR family DNA-binding domain-containing protein [Robiginitalea sp.]